MAARINQAPKLLHKVAVHKVHLSSEVSFCNVCLLFYFFISTSVPLDLVCLFLTDNWLRPTHVRDLIYGLI